MVLLSSRLLLFNRFAHSAGPSRGAMAKEEGKQQQQEDSIPQVSEEEFNPWEAYYKPESASYQKRLRDEKNHIHSIPIFVHGLSSKK